VDLCQADEEPEFSFRFKQIFATSLCSFLSQSLADFVE